MKWFWYSLIGFCLLMCSCASKKASKSVGLKTECVSKMAYLNHSAMIDTSKTIHINQLSNRIVIEEDITITEYDKESGKPIKETHAKRKATQDTDQVATEEETKGVSEVRRDSLNQFRETTQMMDADIKEESVGGQESFGKWFGIGLSCVVAIFLIYLLRKLRIN